MTFPLKPTLRLGFLFSTALLLSLVALTWANYRFAAQNPGGNDFLVHWVGARGFMLEGRSPYSDATARAIQEMAYGHPAQEGEHELRVVYPFYSELLFAPFALISNYTWARAVWMTFLEVALVALAIQSMQLARWRPAPWLFSIFLLFSMLWYHSLRPLINGNAVVIVALLVAAALAAIVKQRDITAGLCLAFATIKPHLVFLLIVFITLWAVSRRRWTLLAWMYGGVLFLVALGMVFIPNWPLQNLWEILKFPDYNPALSLGEAIESWLPGVGVQLKWFLTAFLLGLLVLEWWRAWGKRENHFLWTACLTLAIGQWIGIATDPGNFIILFTPVVLIFAFSQKRWGVKGVWVTLALMLLLFVGIWSLFLRTVEFGYQPQQHPVMFIPLPLFTLIGLYWSRWWFLSPTHRIILENPSLP